MATTTATAAAARPSRLALPLPPAGPAVRVGLDVGGDAKGQSHRRRLPVAAELVASPVPARPGPSCALRVQALGYSIPSGPRASPERNCLTNWLSELKSSSAGPDSTIRPFQR